MQFLNSVSGKAWMVAAGAAAWVCTGLISPGPARAQSLDGLLTNVTDTMSDVTDVLLPGVTNIRIGLGPVISPAYQGSDDYKVRAAPVISFRYRDLVQVDNNRVRVNVFGRDSIFQSENFKAGPLLRLDFGRDETDSPDLAGLCNVGTSLELGLFASYTAGPARARVRFRQDVLSGHKGMTVIGDLSVAIYRDDKLTITSTGQMTWANNKYMDSYFTVNAAQALASGLAAFDAGSGLKDIGISLGANYFISDQWSLLGSAGYEKILSDAKDSPIVSVQGSSNQFTAGVFAIYTF
jgi:outer membrane protein